MMHRIHSRWACAVAGPVLIALASACSDAPSSPWPSARNVEPEQAVGHTADAPIRDDVPFVAAGGEMITRREVRARDGQLYVIEAIRDNRGLPREVRVSRHGQSVARLSNAWRRTAAGYELEHQRMTRYASGRATAMVDSRSGGGVNALAGGPIVVAARDVAASRADAAGVSSATRLRSLAMDEWTDGGGCDAEARATEEAIDEWLYSVVLMGGATATANPWAAWAAYAYQLKKYRDMDRAESALDKCVAEAGKP